MPGKFKTVESYFATLDTPVKSMMEQMRETIRKAAPAADEVISYNMPAFKQDGVLVWYAAFKKHIGFFPKPSGIEAFPKETSKYRSAKGTLQFPLDEPLPLRLVAKIVKFRIKENSLKSKSIS